MAVAQPSVFSTKLKLIEPLPVLVKGNKFLKWVEVNIFKII